jgi:hypothetical protein
MNVLESSISEQELWRPAVGLRKMTGVDMKVTTGSGLCLSC